MKCSEEWTRTASMLESVRRTGDRNTFTVHVTAVVRESRHPVSRNRIQRIPMTIRGVSAAADSGSRTGAVLRLTWVAARASSRRSQRSAAGGRARRLRPALRTRGQRDPHRFPAPAPSARHRRRPRRGRPRAGRRPAREDASIAGLRNSWCRRSTVPSSSSDWIMADRMDEEPCDSRIRRGIRMGHGPREQFTGDTECPAVHRAPRRRPDLGMHGQRDRRCSIRLRDTSSPSLRRTALGAALSGWPSKRVAHASFSAAVGSGSPAATLAASAMDRPTTTAAADDPIPRDCGIAFSHSRTRRSPPATPRAVEDLLGDAEYEVVAGARQELGPLPRDDGTGSHGDLGVVETAASRDAQCQPERVVAGAQVRGRRRCGDLDEEPRGDPDSAHASSSPSSRAALTASIGTRVGVTAEPSAAWSAHWGSLSP